MIRLVLWLSLGLFGLGGLGMSLANRKAVPATRHRRWLKYVVYILIVYTVLGSAVAGSFFFAALMLLIVILGGYELFVASRKTGFSPFRLSEVFTTTLLYLLFAIGLLLFASQCGPEAQVFVYLTIAVFDGFSQVAGQLFGRHRFAPKISPNKTVEGTLGGIAVAVLTAIALRCLLQSSFSHAMLLGVSLSLAALSGDLLASWYKRKHGIKDFGTILPGHGGVLDRFDSLFAAATLFWWQSWLV